MAFRIGIDTGGTFTDLACFDDKGEFRMYKSPTTPNDYSQGILKVLKTCAGEYGLALEDFFRQVQILIVHGSTIATNTVIEGKGAKVGLLCTAGHNAILWRRGGNKQDVFNYYMPYPEPLVPPHLCLEVVERINAEGGVEIALEEESVRTAIRKLRDWKVEAIGVCLLWSIVNPSHEKRIGEIIREEWPEIPYSLSFELQPIIREYHRTSCVAFDAMLKPIMTRYAKNFRNTLAQCGFHKEFLMVVSSGGIMTASEATAKPVYTLFSGPSMGPSAGLFFAEQEGIKDCVTVDMGGTSFDVSAIIDGRPVITREAHVGEDPTGVTSVEVIALGAGGGSIAWVDAGGLLHVGPQSAGADPGPACYGIGGMNPTVTDANVVLGYLNPDFFLGGTMRIRPEQARRAIEEKVARPLGQGIEAAAAGIFKIVNTNMVGGILDMTVRRGIDPREFLLIAGGGAGPTHAVRIAKELEMKRILIPRMSPVLCAMGMLNADYTFSYVGSKYSNTGRFDLEGVNAMLADLESKAGAALDREKIPAGDRRFEYYVAARYPMEISEIDLPLRGGRMTRESVKALAEDFHLAHSRRYAVSDPESVIECTDWRVLGIGVIPKMRLQVQGCHCEDPAVALKGSRMVYFDESDGFVQTPVYDWEKLYQGMTFSGPAVLESSLTTAVVIPGSRVSVNEVGSLFVEIQ